MATLRRAVINTAKQRRGSSISRALWHHREMKTIGGGDSADQRCGSPTDEDTSAALDRLSRQAFEAGLYDRNEMPEGGNDE